MRGEPEASGRPAGLEVYKSTTSDVQGAAQARSQGWLALASGNLENEVWIAVDLYSGYSDDASLERGSTYVRTSQTSGDKNLYFSLPIPTKNAGLSATGAQAEIVDVKIYRESGETWWNKYLYVQSGATLTQAATDATGYSGDATWSGINHTVNSEQRVVLRLVTTASGGTAEKLYGISVKVRWVQTAPAYETDSGTVNLSTSMTEVASASLAASSTSSRVLVVASVHLSTGSGTALSAEWELQVAGSTVEGPRKLLWTGSGGDAGDAVSIVTLPASTSSRSYSVEAKQAAGTNTVACSASIVVIELTS